MVRLTVQYRNKRILVAPNAKSHKNITKTHFTFSLKKLSMF